MAENMFLYWGSGSIPCWKPMIVLEEKGFGGYKNKLITFSKKEHKGEDILKLNPRGQVPTFKDGDIVVNESNAICDYLESTYKGNGTKLIPDDKAKRAKVLQRMHEAASNMQQKMMLDVIYYMWQTKEEDRKEEDVTKKMDALKEELNRWEGYLGETKAFLAGPDFSMADVYFYPYIAFAVRMGLELEKLPNLKVYFDKASARPSLQATQPPHWKEEEPKNTPLKGIL
ncbi:glutathione S-transferase A-like [Saccostrea echinata]|uniref:glutathione S-transferase A-like n=1 Tax=Saccostrea echinata TaxID=191078 RepID=UPI002A83F627|nr:glutathione S-transferase A-like [Saccostrea echinata]